jgi:hypothetical protein
MEEVVVTTCAGDGIMRVWGMQTGVLHYTFKNNQCIPRGMCMDVATLS